MKYKKPVSFTNIVAVCTIYLKKKTYYFNFKAKNVTDLEQPW